MPAHAIDKNWFQQKLRQKNQNSADLARELDLDRSAVTRMFSGKRKMRLDEASAIAQFLGVPAEEVLRRAVMRNVRNGEPSILISAFVDEIGQVQKLKKAMPVPHAVITALSAYDGLNIVAAQIRAASGALAILDDAVILFCATETVEATAIGTLAICRSNDGKQLLGKFERMRRTGEACVRLADGELRELVLDAATPVFAIVP